MTVPTNRKVTGVTPPSRAGCDHTHKILHPPIFPIRNLLYLRTPNLRSLPSLLSSLQFSTIALDVVFKIILGEIYYPASTIDCTCFLALGTKLSILTNIPSILAPNAMLCFNGILRAFVAISAVVYVVSAANIDAALKRQNVPLGTGGSTSSTIATPTTTAAVSSTEVVSSTSVITSVTSTTSPQTPSAAITPTQPSSSAGTETTITSQPSPTPTQDSTSLTTASSSTSAAPESTAQQLPTNPVTSQQILVTSTQPVSSRTQQVTTTVVIVSGSSTMTTVRTATTVVAVTSLTSASTAAPGLNSTNDNSGSSGLQPAQRRIIIGVVVGIGGVILLGGLALVAWRIWGKKRNLADDDDDLMGSQLGSSGHEKPNSAPDNSPFRSTLDQYHAPTGPVNTSSNF